MEAYENYIIQLRITIKNLQVASLVVQWAIDAFVIRNCQKQWQSICKVNNFSIVIQGQNLSRFFAKNYEFLENMELNWTV